MEEEAGGGDAPATKSIHPSTIKGMYLIHKLYLTSLSKFKVIPNCLFKIHFSL